MKTKVAIIGLGYWGPNFVRNFIGNPKTEVIWGCDFSDEALKKISQFYPQVKLTKNYKDIIQDNSINLVMITTPPENHYQIAKEALLSGKHVLIAKPLTTNSKQAIELLKIAQSKNLLLYGDLTYLFTGAVQHIKKYVQSQRMGKALYYDSTRSNLGLIQKNVNVIWDLAPHDFAIIDYCFNLEPEKVFASASNHFGNSNNDQMAHITINYTNNFIAHIHVSWISPVKLRTILIGGTKKMIFYDDVEPDEKIKIYDKGIDISSEDITYMKPVYRSGGIIIPKIKAEEAISSEISDIVKQLSRKKLDYQNALLNIKIIQLLEACDKSLRTKKTGFFE